MADVKDAGNFTNYSSVGTNRQDTGNKNDSTIMLENFDKENIKLASRMCRLESLKSSLDQITTASTESIISSGQEPTNYAVKIKILDQPHAGTFYGPEPKPLSQFQGTVPIQPLWFVVFLYQYLLALGLSGLSIALDGNISAGKSSIIRELLRLFENSGLPSDLMDFYGVLEKAHFTVLELFIKHPNDLASEMQIHMWNDAFHRQLACSFAVRNLQRKKVLAAQDRSCMGNLSIAEANIAHGRFNALQKQFFEQVTLQASEGMLFGHQLLIYVDTAVYLCLIRMELRGSPGEQEYVSDYITTIEKRHFVNLIITLLRRTGTVVPRSIDKGRSVDQIAKESVPYVLVFPERPNSTEGLMVEFCNKIRNFLVKGMQPEVRDVKSRGFAIYGPNGIHIAVGKNILSLPFTLIESELEDSILGLVSQIATDSEIDVYIDSNELSDAIEKLSDSNCHRRFVMAALAQNFKVILHLH